MNRYEYIIVFIGHDEDEKLNEYGAQGWEAVAVDWAYRPLRVMFKRECRAGVHDVDEFYED